MWKNSAARSFERDLLALPKEIAQPAVSEISLVLQNPYRGKKLKGTATRYAIRLGRDFRLVYSVYKKGEVGRL